MTLFADDVCQVAHLVDGQVHLVHQLHDLQPATQMQPTQSRQHQQERQQKEKTTLLGTQVKLMGIPSLPLAEVNINKSNSKEQKQERIQQQQEPRQEL